MPANGPTIRGKPGPHLTRDGLAYDSNTGLYFREQEYIGSQSGVAGLSDYFRGLNKEHRSDYEGGIARITVRTPQQGADILDRYEILWEMEQREIWTHPTVHEAALSYDSGLVAGENTFRQRAEAAIDGFPDADAASDPISGSVFVQVVANLRAGITNWEQEYITLRRTRVVPPGSDAGATVNITAASLIYTTNQLLLPDDVVFVIPSDAQINAFPNPDPTNFLWGWRRRPSTVTIQGQNSEQTSEFLLAAWSLLFFEASSGDADW